MNPPVAPAAADRLSPHRAWWRRGSPSSAAVFLGRRRPTLAGWWQDGGDARGLRAAQCGSDGRQRRWPAGPCGPDLGPTGPIWVVAGRPDLWLVLQLKVRRRMQGTAGTAAVPIPRVTRGLRTSAYPPRIILGRPNSTVAFFFLLFLCFFLTNIGPFSVFLSFFFLFFGFLFLFIFLFFVFLLFFRFSVYIFSFFFFAFFFFLF